MKMLRSFHSTQPGFTLVEAVIAIGVLAASVVGVFRLYVGTSLSSGTSLETTSAAIIASRKYEELVALAQDDWDDTDISIGTYSETVTDPVNGDKYTVNWEISDFDDNGRWKLQNVFTTAGRWRVALRAHGGEPSEMSEGFREVDITVSYVSAAGKTMPQAPDGTTCSPDSSVADCPLRYHGSIVKNAYGTNVF